jgi:hypothetical protein
MALPQQRARYVSSHESRAARDRKFHNSPSILSVISEITEI